MGAVGGGSIPALPTSGGWALPQSAIGVAVASQCSYRSSAAVVASDSVVSTAGVSAAVVLVVVVVVVSGAAVAETDVVAVAVVTDADAGKI